VYREELPEDGTELVFSPNRTLYLDRVPPDLFEVLAAISRHRTVGAVIEECGLTDLTICRTLLMLVKEKIVVVAESA